MELELRHLRTLRAIAEAGQPHPGGDSRLQGHQAQPGWEPPNVPVLWERV